MGPTLRMTAPLSMGRMRLSLGKRHGGGYRPGMDLYLPAMMLLSGGAFIHSRSNVPELRPASEAADTAWKLLARFAFFLWIGLLVWGAYQRPLMTVVAAFVLSLLFNVLLAIRGPRPIWPGLSMILASIGLTLGVYTVLAG